MLIRPPSSSRTVTLVSYPPLVLSSLERYVHLGQPVARQVIAHGQDQTSDPCDLLRGDPLDDRPHRPGLHQAGELLDVEEGLAINPGVEGLEPERGGEAAIDHGDRKSVV